MRMWPIRILVLLLFGGTLFGGSIADERKVARYLKNPEFVWNKHEDRHFIYFTEEASFAAGRLNQLTERMLANRTSVLTVLGEKDAKLKPFAFFVSSRAKMKMLVGAEVNGMALPASDAIFMVYSPGIDAVTPHELFHLYARNLWGTPKMELVNEGMAVAVGDLWHQQPIHQLAAFLKANRKLVPIADLIGNFTGHDDMVSYPQAGSFLKFLHDKYGAGSIKAIWKKDTAGSFEKQFKKSLGDLETEWLLMLDSQNYDSVKYSI